jgi:hypothetical protein
VFHLSGPAVTNAMIYNNTIYIAPASGPLIVHEGRWKGYPTSACFYNNIFYNAGFGGYDISTSAIQFDYNVFYGYHPSNEPDDPHKITDDPLLVNPGSAGLGIDSVDGYKLQAGSPAIGAGMIIPNNGGKDYWGNPVPSDSPPDIGAHQYSGEPTPTPGPSPTPPPTDTPVPTSTPAPTATPGGATEMHVNDIHTTDVDGTPKDVFSATNREIIYYRALIHDQFSSPVDGATVHTEILWPNGGVWTTQESTTGPDGWALFEKRTTKVQPKGRYTVNVTDVVLAGATYNPAANVKDSHQFDVQ